VILFLFQRSIVGTRKSADKCFAPYFPLISELIGTIYEIVINTLKKENVLVEQKNKAERIWGIVRNVLCVSDLVIQFRCKKNAVIMCRHRYPKNRSGKIPFVLDSTVTANIMNKQKRGIIMRLV